MLKFFGRKSQFVICFCLVLFALFSSSSNVFATSASLSTSGTVNVDIMPSRDGGVGTSISASEVNVVTNCRAGYNLSISGPTDRNLYRNGDSTNNTQGQYFTPVDGTSILKNTTNAWGYSLSANTDSGVFSPLSNTPTLLKTTAQTASETDIDDDITIYYGVSVSNSLNPGTYEMANNGSIVYQLTMDPSCIDFEVMFNPNGGTGTMSKQNIIINESTKLSANSFTAPAMGTSYQNANGTTIPATANKLWTFWGWNTAVDGTGDWYKDRESVTNLANQGETITLYAQWKQATLADLNTPTSGTKTITHNTMQDMSPATCYNSDITTAANAPAATLLDYRGKITTGDNPESPEQYTVSKLADGNCWMTKNLNLGRENGGPNGDGTITLTSEDSDISNNYTLVASSEASLMLRITNSNGNNNNGAYYAWQTAVASNGSFYNSKASTSACPRNWDLPTASQWRVLSTKSNYSSSNRTTSLPSSFLVDGGYTGGYGSSTSFYQTSYSYYWSADSVAANAAYAARVNETSIAVSEYGNRDNKKNIRCLASRGTVSINYDGNGTNEFPVTGTVASRIDLEINNGSNTISFNGFERPGWVFKAWNTKADGSGTEIVVDKELTALDVIPGETITLYAQWTPIYTITYVNNCAAYADSNSNCTQSISDSTATQKINLNNSGNGSGTLAAYNRWTTLSNWKITSWNTKADGSGTDYGPSTSYSVTNQAPGDGIVLYARWTPTYTIQYHGNGADIGSNSTSKHINVAENDVFDLAASKFGRTNYGFAGWSFDQNAQPGGSSKIYGPNEDITAPAASSPGETKYLYAIWVQSVGNLQTWNGCSNMSIGYVTALTDLRDNNTYAVAKLADGSCWMIENLRLQYDASHNSDGTLAQGYGGAFEGLAQPETEHYENTTTTNTLYSTTNITGSNQGYRFPRYYDGPSNSESTCTEDPNGTSYCSGGSYSYGNYYTWAAAMANTNNYTTKSSTVDGKTSETVNTSICPSGWRLPYGDTSGNGNSPGGFYYLNYMVNNNSNITNELASQRMRSYPNNFVYSGDIYTAQSTMFSGRGSVGEYWSSTSYSNSNAYAFSLKRDSVYYGVSTSYYKFRGRPVRCVKTV